MRMTIHAVHSSGMPIDIELERDEVDKLDAYIVRLLQKGYRAPVQDWPTSPDGQPLCPKHNVAMPVRERQGDVWHSHRVITEAGEELYCRGTPYGDPAKDGFLYVPGTPVGWPSGPSGAGMSR